MGDGGAAAPVPKSDKKEIVRERERDQRRKICANHLEGRDDGGGVSGEG